MVIQFPFAQQISSTLTHCTENKYDRHCSEINIKYIHIEQTIPNLIWTQNWRNQFRGRYATNGLIPGLEHQLLLYLDRLS